MSNTQLELMNLRFCLILVVGEGCDYTAPSVPLLKKGGGRHE